MSKSKERFDPDGTVLLLEFIKKQATKTSDKKQAVKTIEHKKKIYDFLSKNGSSKAKDIAEYIELSPARTMIILSEMEDIQAEGENRNRKYFIK